MATLTLTQAAAGLTSGALTSGGLIEAALARIDVRRGEGARAFTRVYHDEARRRAREADKRRAAGQARSALDGVPVSIKDQFDVAGEPTTAGSRVLADSALPGWALAIERCLAAG